MARKAERKVILTAAVSGNAHTKEMSPAVPYGVEEISDAALCAIEAGASMVHIHARKADGTPTANVQIFGDILSRTKERAKGDPILGITTGSAVSEIDGGDAGVEERLAPVHALKPEIASFNSGSINFATSNVPESYGEVFANSFSDMFTCIDAMNQEGTLPEFETFDFGMLNNILYLQKQGKLERPPYFQFVPGPLGCIPLNQDNVAFYIQSVRRMFGADSQFSMVSMGRRNFRYGVFSALWGGNVRIGLEDSLYLSADGTLARNNGELIRKMRRLLEELDFQIATPEETREMLQLKGSAKVNF